MSYPLIVGIGGASGAPYGMRLPKLLRGNKSPAHLIVSKFAAQTLKEETRKLVGEASARYCRALPAARHACRCN